ncbi:MAG: hypothetical protein J6V44_16400 [Methanobrevibacter sp.]|nr:hypothetical protein [Methanobrevibacter sp.]MBO7692018.1 hypothetical protein [Methanobrevibacter sp.]
MTIVYIILIIVFVLNFIGACVELHYRNKRRNEGYQKISKNFTLVINKDKVDSKEMAQVVCNLFATQMLNDKIHGEDNRAFMVSRFKEIMHQIYEGGDTDV